MQIENRVKDSFLFGARNLNLYRGRMMTKETYVTPEMETLGSFETLTRSTSSGITPDFAYTGIVDENGTLAGQLS